LAPARFIRHALLLQSLDVLSLAVAMILPALGCALVSAVRPPAFLSIGIFATARAAVPLAPEVAATDAEHGAAALAVSSKQRDTIARPHRPGEAGVRS
jgi:hypothetical protein